MSSTLQGKIDVGGAPSTSALPAATDFPEPAVRLRYVVGVFHEPSHAYGAVAGLPSEPCEVLVVFEAAPGREAKSVVMADGRVTIDTLEASGTLASKLTAALCKLGTFAALSAQSWTDAQNEFPSPGMQRLFQNLVHHLAAGATVVIIHTPGTEQQLLVSRALLDAKCDTLLTHDVLPTRSGSSPEPAHKEDCCQSCATRSCGRIDLP